MSKHESKGVGDTLPPYRGRHVVPMLRVTAEQTVPDGMLSPMVYGITEFGLLTIMCAETGYGKTYVANRIMSEARGEGRPVYRYSFDGVKSDQARRRLVRRCREVRNRMESGQLPLMVIDGVTPGDEIESASEAHAIQALCDAGAQVIVCIRPEARQLCEAFEHVMVIGPEDLLYRQTEEDGLTAQLTGGIPALVAALRSDRVMCEDGELGGPRYQAALEELLEKTLRTNVANEEFRVRLAAVLLGRGSMDDLALVSGRCDAEQIFSLEQDVALLGVDYASRTFCCHGIDADALLRSCLTVLQAPAACEGDLVVRACGLLAYRGEAHRSAIVSRLCATERDFTSVCVMWGVSYAAIGEVELVHDALQPVDGGDGDHGARALLSDAVVQSLVGSARDTEASWQRLDEVRLCTPSEERLYALAELFVACRAMLRNPRSASQRMGFVVRDEMAIACRDHLRVARLLSSGRFNEAYSLVTNELFLGKPRSLPEAFLCDDLYLALSMSGGISDAKEQDFFRRADALYDAPGLKRLHSYHVALKAMPDILLGDETDSELVEEAASISERAGDSFFHAVCLTVCAVADVRLKALSRAHVRSRKASDIAHALGEEYLASAADLVNALALEMLGEVGSLERFCESSSRPDDLALMGRLCLTAARDSQPDEVYVEVSYGTSCPRDAIWVVNMVSTSCPEIWDAMMGLVPSTWLELLRSVRARRAETMPLVMPKEQRRLRANASAGLPGEQTELLPPAAADDGRIRISILGRLSVECGDRRLPAGAFDRRRSRDLVTLLALMPGHRMRRYQIIDVLWPGDDYLRGPRKLYEATGEARKHLARLKPGTCPLVTDRIQGTVGFDSALVTCDVDDFDREARLALAEDGDDFWILDHARKVERLYADGPGEHLAALGEVAAERARELQTLYVDCMIAAGEASLRLGKNKLAVRYAQTAHRLDDLREDAMILLVRALRASGRGHETADLYRTYSRATIDARGVPPSLAVRRAVEQAVGGGNGALPS